jgi:hypothetical protein
MIGGGQGRQAGDLQAAVHDHRVLNETIGLVMAVHDCNAERARLLLAPGRARIRAVNRAAGIRGIASATPGPAARPEGEAPPR